MEQLKKLFAILHKWKPYYLLSACLLIFSTLFRMLEPKILQVAIDGIIVYFQSEGAKQPSTNDPIAQVIYDILPALTLNNLAWVLICLGLIYACIAVIRGISMFSASAISAWCTEKATKRLRDNLFQHIQRLPLSFHSKLSTGEMIQRATGDIETVKTFIGSQVVDILLLAAIVVASFAMMASVHVTYAFIAISVTPLLFLLSYFFFNREQEVWKRHEEEQDKLISIVEENLAGIRVVKAFAQEESEMAKFTAQNDKKYAVGIEHLKLHNVYWPISDTLFHVQVTLSLIAGGYFAMIGQITIGELASFYTYAIMISWPMRRIGQIISKMGMAFVAVNRLSSILDAMQEDYTGIIREEGLQGDIVFENVWFKYPKNEEWTLKDVSFTVKAGEVVALLGPTGSGKSTIINLLVRFYEPQKGKIYIDGIDISTLNKAYLRNKIGLVLQKPFLFSTTIRQNIAYTNPSVSEEKIVQASTAASMHHIMHVFAKGYDTVVGEKGVTLSGGQKQRVALARTLIEQPDILVLDDATSAVDTETEYHIQQALEKHMQGKTSFIIAHRITAIQQAHKIIVLDEGKVMNVGTQQELLQQPGFFKAIYEVQATIEKDLIA